VELLKEDINHLPSVPPHIFGRGVSPPCGPRRAGLPKASLPLLSTVDFSVRAHLNGVRLVRWNS